MRGPQVQTVDKRLNKVSAKWDSRPALGVVLSAGGYPDKYEQGKVITGIYKANNSSTKVFHAGTSTNKNGEIVSAGGRVLCVTAIGENITEAQTKAYQAVAKISWENMYNRTDIGHKAVTRETYN